MYITRENSQIKATRSSGPGGQNVNKRSTAVRLRANIEDLNLADDQKQDLRNHLPKRFLTKDDEIIVENSETRSQKQNKQRVLDTANEAVEKALEKAKQLRDKKAHKKRARKRQAKAGSGSSKNKKEKLKEQRRSETTEDLLEQALREDPDLRERLNDD